MVRGGCRLLTGRQLLFLVVATVLPVALFAAAVMATYTAEERADLDATLESTAIAVADAVNRQLERELEALSTLSSSEALEHGDLSAFRHEATRFMDANDPWRVVVLTDGARQLVNTRIPEGEPLPPLLDAASNQEVVRQGRAIVAGRLQTRSPAPEPVVMIRVPAPHGGAPRFVIGAAIPASAFQKTLDRVLPVAEGRIALVDQDRRIIARSAGNGSLDPAVGSTVDRPAAETEDEDAAEPRSVMDGRTMLVAEAGVPLAGWRVIVGVPMDTVDGLMRQIRLALFAGGVATAALAAAVAVVVLGSLARRRQAERQVALMEAERVAEERLTGMARTFPGALYRRVLRPDGSVETSCIGDAATGLLGPADGASARDLAALMAPETAQRWRVELDRTARTLEPLRLEGRLLDAKGRNRRFRTDASTRRLADGSVVWDGVILDITELREAEQARRLTADRLTFVLEAVNAGIFDADLTAGRITASESLWRLLQEPEGAAGSPQGLFGRLIHPDDADAVCRGIRAAGETASAFEAEMRIRRHGGEERWLSVAAQVFLDADGKPGRIIGFCIDVTERRRIETEVRAAKDAAEHADHAKSRFLAAASHDLRQPVQSLMFFAHVLAERLDGHPAQPLVGTMQQALDALKSLLDGILDLSRLDAGVIVPTVEPVEVGALFERMRQEYRLRFAEKGLRLRVRPTAAVVLTDASLLGRIVGNFVENALKYTESGGVLLAARRVGDGLRIGVWDTGIGIAGAHFQEIFSEFVQLDNPERDRSRGLGLGLAIVKRLATLLDHPVQVRSRPGRGSVFSVTVPLFRPDGRSHGAGTGSGPTIVVVDGDTIVRESLEAVLEQWGYRVIATADPRAGLAFAQAGGEPPAAVIIERRLVAPAPDAASAVSDFAAQLGGAVPLVLLSDAPAAEAAIPGCAGRVVTAPRPVSPPELKRILDGVTASA